MKNIQSFEELELKIIAIESQIEIDKSKVKLAFDEFYLSFKPMNIIKSLINVSKDSSEVKDSVINTTVGISSGFMAKKAFELLSSGPLSKLIGSGIMIGVSNLMSKHPEYIQTALGKLVHVFQKKPNPNSSEINTKQNDDTSK
jgi:hypothetical protein